MKITTFLLILTSLLCFTLSAKLKIRSKEKPLFMEKVITSKPTSVKANFQFEGQHQTKSPSPLQKDQRFKEIPEQFQLDPSKLETPVIIPNKNIPINEPFNMNQRLAQGKNSPLSNSQRFDVLHPNHESYYDQRKYTIYDSNYKVNHEDLLKQFKANLQKVLNSNGIKSDNVEDYKLNLNKVNEGLKHTNVITVNHIGEYDGSLKNGKGTYVQTSNPMKDIFH